MSAICPVLFFHDTDLRWCRQEWVSQQGIRNGNWPTVGYVERGRDAQWVTRPQAEHPPIWLTRHEDGAISLFNPHIVQNEPVKITMEISDCFIAFLGKDAAVRLIFEDESSPSVLGRLNPLHLCKADPSTGKSCMTRSKHFWSWSVGRLPDAHHAVTGRMLALANASTVVILDADTFEEACRIDTASRHPHFAILPAHEVAQLRWSHAGNLFAALLQTPSPVNSDSLPFPKEVCIYSAATGACLQSLQLSGASYVNELSWSSSMNLLSVRWEGPSMCTLSNYQHPFHSNSSFDDPGQREAATRVEIINYGRTLNVPHAEDAGEIGADSNADGAASRDSNCLIFLDPVQKAAKCLAGNLLENSRHLQNVDMVWLETTWDPARQLVLLQGEDCSSERPIVSIIDPSTGDVLISARNFHRALGTVWASHPPIGKRPAGAMLICGRSCRILPLTLTRGEWHAQRIQDLPTKLMDFKAAPDGSCLNGMSTYIASRWRHFQVAMPSLEVVEVKPLDEGMTEATCSVWASFPVGWSPVYAFARWPQSYPIHKRGRLVSGQLVLVDAHAHLVICSLPIKDLINATPGLVARAIRRSGDWVRHIIWSPCGSHLALLFREFVLVLSFGQHG